jgi:hypothetical protein
VTRFSEYTANIPTLSTALLQRNLQQTKRPTGPFFFMQKEERLLNRETAQNTYHKIETANESGWSADTHLNIPAYFLPMGQPFMRYHECILIAPMFANSSASDFVKNHVPVRALRNNTLFGLHDDIRNPS